MATKQAEHPTNRRGDSVDSRGNVRIVADIPKGLADEFAILAIRRGFKNKRELVIRLITDAVSGKIPLKS